MHPFFNALSAVILCGPLAALAGPILAPVSVTANVATPVGGWSLGALVDQSGMSAPYVPGVTDFDTYLAGVPTHVSGQVQNTWASEIGVTAASLTFDLGGSTAIESLAIWNRGLTDQGIKNFSLFACADATCTIEVDLGDFTALTALGSDDAVRAQTFSFAATAASFMRMDIVNGYNDIVLVLGEVAFEQAAAPAGVPEPTSPALVGLSLAGLAAARRRRASP